MNHYLACDLGAESGRIIAGTLADGRLTLEELHRFANTPIQSADGLHWNVDQLIVALKQGLQKAAARGLAYDSFSADAWGVDYLLFDSAGRVLPPTFHYRDSRTARGVAAVRARVDEKTVYGETGIQFMPLNTIYQLAAESPARMSSAAQLLLIADGIHYLLSGVAAVDESSASTTQLYNPETKGWSQWLIQAIGLPAKIFPRIVPCGTRLGRLKPDVALETGLPAVEVIASCSHDTGAAVAAVPARGRNWAYLSSGTWSLMGVEVYSPRITEASREMNFTNEIGFGGSVRLLKNISGLWLVQECRRDWARAGQDFSYEKLTEMADASPPFAALINPADPRFLAPDGMPERISAFCAETGQAAPATPGAYIRCILESLALLYRRTREQIEQLTGDKISRLHIVGGGSKNQLLNQLTANAVQVPVVIGPVEATAIGNIVVQAVALGHLPSMEAARDVVRHSFEVTELRPQGAETWNAAYDRFVGLL